MRCCRPGRSRRRTGRSRPSSLERQWIPRHLPVHWGREPYADSLRTVTDPQKHNVSRSERVLAFMLLALVLLSVGTFVAIMVGTMQGMGSDDFASGLWPVVVMVPYIGLPLAIVLLITLMVSSAVRRARESRRDQPEH